MRTTAGNSTEHRAGSAESSSRPAPDWSLVIVPPLVGGLAFVAGLVLTGGLVVLDTLGSDGQGLHHEVDTDLEWLETIEPETLTLLNWFYFNAQFVDLEASAFGVTERLDVLTLAANQGPVPAAAYTVIPIAVLVAGGWVVARSTVGTEGSPIRGAAAGATVTSGYLVAVLIGAQSSTWTPLGFGTLGSVQVPVTEAVMIAGVGFPLLFGAIGGVLGTRG